MPADDQFETRLRAYLVRRAARDGDAAAVERLAQRSADAFAHASRARRVTTLALAVVVPTLLAAVLASAVLLHVRNAGTRPSPPAVAGPTAMPSPTAAPSPTPSPPAPTPSAAPTRAPSLGVVAVAGPSPWRFTAAMGTGPGLPVIFYGGRGQSTSSSCGDLFDTYTWDGRRWYRVTTAAGPRLVRPVLGWDPITGHVLLVGGSATPYPDCATSSAETWSWQPAGAGPGGRWSRLQPSHAPESAFTNRWLAFDAAHRLLVYTAYDQGIDSWGASTWTWNGRDWTQAWSAECGMVPPNAPPSCPVAPTDGAQGPNGTVIGFASGSGNVETVVRWTGSTWTTVSSSGPPPWRAGVAYDARSGHVLVLGGDGYAGPFLLYVYDGTRWTQSPLPAALQHRTPSAFSGGASDDGLLWGGVDDASAGQQPQFTDTWAYGQGSWRDVAT